jgi:proteasomal ATPase-associated factor 1
MIWLLPEDRCVTTLMGHNRAITSINLIGQGRYFVSSSKDGTIKLWDCSKQEPVASYAENKAGLDNPIHHSILIQQSGLQLPSMSSTTTVQPSLPQETDGYLVIGAFDDATIRGYDLRQQTQAISMHFGINHPVTRLAALSNTSIVVGNEVGILRTFDLRQPKEAITSVRKNDAAITSLLALSSKSFLQGSAEGDCTVWDVATSSIVAEFTGVDCEPVTSLSTTSEYIYAAGGNQVRQYNLKHLQSADKTSKSSIPSESSADKTKLSASNAT